MQNKCLIIEIILILWIIDVRKIHGNELCWNNEHECNIKTELFKNKELSSNGISMQIDCRSDLNPNSQDQLKKDGNDFQKSAKYLLLPRLMGIQSILLDGCQTPLNAPTFGLELLPICANISKVSIRHFHMDTLRPLYCNESPQQLQLEYLNIQFNELAVIDGGSFPHSYFHLKNVLIEKNLLKVIHRDTFKSIRSLESLYIVNEPALILKFPDLFEYTSILTIHLETLKQMTSGIFDHLPKTLQNLYVAHTPLDNDMVLLRNSLVLQNLTIKYCALQKFTLDDVHSTVRRIDLSGNVMKIFTAYEKNNLKELILNNNQLECLPIEWIKNLTNLQSLIIKENHIQVLSLNDLMKVLPNGRTFDFSQNWLQSLQDYENINDLHLSQARLKCDHNPWDCLWLHEFAHYHPEKFRILQYEKFISKINVNGLECIPAEKPLEPAKIKNIVNNTFKVSPNKIVNVSTYSLIYGNPWEFKRNQRAEALIIVFMLPLGIAFLFVLLYMWIYCQKMFHLSYYQNLSCLQRSTNHSTQRFDIVRQLPQRLNPIEPKRLLTRSSNENGEDYEIPISGIMSECNCMMQQNNEISKCEKTIHITYEHLPADEPPHQMYEEIIQVGDYNNHIECLSGIQDAVSAKQPYDHLTF